MTDGSSLSETLARWYAGEPQALDKLIEENHEWVHRVVRARLGEGLRKKLDSMDIVQEAMGEFLRYGPRVRVESEDHFRNLLARIVENVIRDEHDWYHARRRAMSREQRLPAGSVIDLQRSAALTRPDRAAEKGEHRAEVRLAMELLDPDERRVVLLRQWEGLEFAEVGERLGLTADAARMRFQRALPRLAAKVGEIRAGRLRELEPE